MHGTAAVMAHSVRICKCVEEKVNWIEETACSSGENYWLIPPSVLNKPQTIWVLTGFKGSDCFGMVSALDGIR
jgi:hypothetical protein